VSVQELEAEALKLSAADREELIRRLLARSSEDDSVDPLLGLGADPVVCGAANASVQHDRYVYDAAG
jgi:hypothetical protein